MQKEIFPSRDEGEKGKITQNRGSAPKSNEVQTSEVVSWHKVSRCSAWNASLRRELRSASSHQLLVFEWLQEIAK